MYGSSKSKMGMSPKAKKDGSPKKAKAAKGSMSKANSKKMPLLSKGDWKTMPKNKQGAVTYDTIRKTRAAKAKMK